MAVTDAAASQTKTATAGGLPLQSVIAILVFVGAVAFSMVMGKTAAALTPLWLLAMLAGFTLQRSRLCFASAFRDLFLFGSTRTMRAILLGMAVATIGFAVIMQRNVPLTSTGFIPAQAHVLPVGLSVIFGGLFFGFGMVLAGGCVSGSLYRVAEGYIGSWVALAATIVGLALASQTWNFWYKLLIAHEPAIWLPSVFQMGYAGAITLTLVAIGAIFLFLLWWESKNGLSTPEIAHKPEPQDTFREKLSSMWKLIFVRGWPIAAGGIALAVINILMYSAQMPFGVTGELTRWANNLMGVLHIPAPAPLGLDGIGGCSGVGGGGIFTPTFALTVGLLPGALIAALFSREFKLRFPRNPARYVSSLVGGLFMGYGAGLAIGCTIGSFFSAVPSLGLSGWMFGLALAGGSWVGVQAIKRIP